MRSSSPLTKLAVVAGVLAVGDVALAEPARVSLTYERVDAAATECPDEATFRKLVLARLGYDPFDKGGTRALNVTLRPQRTEVAGSLLLTGPAGEKLSARTLRSGDADCFELTTSLALATAIAVDPDAVRAGPPPEPPPDPKPLPPPPPEPTPKPPPRDDQPTSLWRLQSPRARLSLAFVMPVGLTPAPRGGVRAGAGVEGGLWSLVAEGAFLFPSSNAESFGTVSSYVAHGSLVPCAGLPLHSVVLVDLCAVGSLGAMFSDASEVARSDPQTHLFATVGPRAALAVMPWPQFGFTATADVPVNLARAHLLIEDGGESREVWAAERVGFVGGLGLLFHLP
jgi:hypothetical protein